MEGGNAYGRATPALTSDVAASPRQGASCGDGSGGSSFNTWIAILHSWSSFPAIPGIPTEGSPDGQFRRHGS